MSKYDPLKNYLAGSQADQTPMTFAEVEGVLGFPLPPSAKARSWWSNNPGSHVGVPAWRDAGFKVSRVDVESGKVVFARARSGATTQPAPSDTVTVRLDDMSIAARRLLDDYAAQSAGDRAQAVARAVHEAAIARRGRLIDQIVANAPRMPPGEPDSVQLIREDRDAR